MPKNLSEKKLPTKKKILKDPVYGYVSIEEEIFSDIIDTACFQRLRNIRQTSYGPLYSAALHNRFTHSIGVYYLGTLAFEAIRKNVPLGFKKEEYCDLCNRYERIFILACLLHDVGHSPFSHSGEGFYVVPTEAQLNKRLNDAVEDPLFLKEADEHKSAPAKPHERMSALIGLERFPQFFNGPEEKSFFARCITGYKYQFEQTKEISLKNCLIQLLNSSLIDVDRLDYLIRDASVTGFESVVLDYRRLLDSLVIVPKGTGVYQVAYNKSAISVIENVIYSHDSERKWIQNHPVVMYEDFLIRYAINRVNGKFIVDMGAPLFCAEALTEEGKDYSYSSLKHPTEQNTKQAVESLSVEDGPKENTSHDIAQATVYQMPKHFHISLLSDDDLIFLMKNVYKDELCWEYFSRQSRRHPIWKSEAEYRALFDEKLGPESLDKLEEEFASLGKYLDFMNGNFPIINKTALDRIKHELNGADKEFLGNDWENTVNSYKTHIKWMECLERASKIGGFDFDIVLIRAKKFDSGFSKAELSRIPIQFKNLNTVKPFGSVITSLDSVKKRDNFFYLYAKRSGGEINITAFVNEVIQTIFK